MFNYRNSYVELDATCKHNLEALEILANYAVSWKNAFADYDTEHYLNKIRVYMDPTNTLKKEIEKKQTDGNLLQKENQCPKPKKVYYDDVAGITVVMWKDGTKTIVRAAEGDKHDAYLGYCAALAKKIHGTNSALKRDLEKVLVTPNKKEKKNEDSRD